MRYTLPLRKKHGVGIAAPQVGESIALSVIGVKPTPNRPELEPFDTVLINPEWVENIRRTCRYVGRLRELWYRR